MHFVDKGISDGEGNKRGKIPRVLRPDPKRTKNCVRWGNTSSPVPRTAPETKTQMYASVIDLSSNFTIIIIIVNIKSGACAFRENSSGNYYGYESAAHIFSVLFGGA